MKNIRNVYCIGRNYVEHIKELNNKILDEPLVFMKPTHSVVYALNNDINISGDQGDIHYEVELVVQMKTDYDSKKSIDDLIDQMCIGVDLTLRNVQEQLKDEGHPWLKAKGFKNSAILSSSIVFPGAAQIKTIPFSLQVNGIAVQEGKAEQMIFDLATQINYIGENFGLKKGDIIFTGTPSGVNALQDGDHLALIFNGEQLGNCTIRFS